MPSPAPISLPPVTIEIPPVLSVDVPVHCHRLRSFPTPAEHATLVTAITDPHLAVPFNHYFDDGCPFEALYKAYLQVERLGVIVNSPFTTQNAIAPTVKHVARDVQTRLRAELVSVMHQLGMTDFVVDLDRYLKELASAQNLIEEAAAASKNSTPSASSSPLTKEEEIALERTDIWWTGSNHDASLSRDHPRYSETCFQCRKLGHIRINCPLYQCPTCFKWSPGHVQARCPLRRRIPSRQASSSSSSGGGPSRRPQRSHRMVTTKPRLASRISSTRRSRSSSPTYVDDGVTNEAWDNLDDEPAYHDYEF